MMLHDSVTSVSIVFMTTSGMIDHAWCSLCDKFTTITSFCHNLLCKEGSENLPMQRREYALVHDVVRGGPDSTMVTLVISLHVHSNLLCSAIHGPV